MEDVDTLELNEIDDETMFLSDVIQQEHELLFLDSYLRESFRTYGMHGGRSGAGVGVGTGGDAFGEGSLL